MAAVSRLTCASQNFIRWSLASFSVCAILIDPRQSSKSFCTQNLTKIRCGETLRYPSRRPLTDIRLFSMVLLKISNNHSICERMANPFSHTITQQDQAPQPDNSHKSPNAFVTVRCNDSTHFGKCQEKISAGKDFFANR